MARPNSCGKMIKQISDEMQKKGNNAMRSQGMTLSQLSVLLELDQAPEKQRSLKELERSLHVAQSTAAGIISRLEKKGFVEALGDVVDRRIKLVRLTSAGQQRVVDAAKDMVKEEQQLLAALTETEQEIFCVLLQKLCSSLP